MDGQKQGCFRRQALFLPIYGVKPVNFAQLTFYPIPLNSFTHALLGNDDENFRFRIYAPIADRIANRKDP